MAEVAWPSPAGTFLTSISTQRPCLLQLANQSLSLSSPREVEYSYETQHTEAGNRRYGGATTNQREERQHDRTDSANQHCRAPTRSRLHGWHQDMMLVTLKLRPAVCCKTRSFQGSWDVLLMSSTDWSGWLSRLAQLVVIQQKVTVQLIPIREISQKHSTPSVQSYKW